MIFEKNKCGHGLIEEVASLLIDSKHAIALTGAGISSSSGLPIFRGPNGLWNRIDPGKFSIEYFIKNPYDWWNIAKDLAEPFLKAKPTKAHKALAGLEELGLIKGIITQNIDGLHQKAGSKKVIELHGNVNKLKCLLCKSEYDAKHFLNIIKRKEIPLCSNCGFVLKPNVVLFNEAIPHDEYLQALNLFLKSDLVLIIGTSLAIEPVANLVVNAFERGAKLVSINYSETYLDSLMHYSLRCSSNEALPSILGLVKHRKLNKVQ